MAYLGFYFEGGLNFFGEKCGYLHGAKRQVSRGVATRLPCSPEKIFNNSAIWCVLESILLKFC